MGEVAKAAEAAAPGSIRVGGYLVTFIGAFPYADEKGPSGGREEVQ
jgi:hypothetical protein